MTNVARPHMSTVTAPGPVSLGTAPAPRPSLLVATDGRRASAAALLAAARIADRVGAAPQVLDVLQPLPSYGEFPVPPTEEWEEERATAAYGAVRRQLESVVGDAWPTEVAFGPPARTIADVASERRAALVVLGIGRHGVFDRLFGTETALQVLRAGDRPVLAVGPEADGVIRRAVVAVDFGPAAARAAAIAHALLAPGGTLTLVHVRTRLEMSQPVWEAWDARAGRNASELLQRLAVGLRHGSTGCDECGAARRQDVTVGTVTLVGDPASEVLDYAARVGADLVAAGTHGPGLVERLLVGSVASEIVRLTSARLPGCSVLCCPAPPAPAAP
jgi:nucleotide-binding universal stress UspA family protein